MEFQGCHVVNFSRFCICCHSLSHKLSKKLLFRATTSKYYHKQIQMSTFFYYIFLYLKRKINHYLCCIIVFAADSFNKLSQCFYNVNYFLDFCILHVKAGYLQYGLMHRLSIETNINGQLSEYFYKY